MKRNTRAGTSGRPGTTGPFRQSWPRRRTNGSPKAKALWMSLKSGVFPRTRSTQAQPSEPKPRKRVRQVSKSQAQRNNAYRSARNRFMKANPRCQALGCNKASTELHHMRGRRHLLLDERFWKALCREHHEMCTSSPSQAHDLGIVCGRGEWGKSE